MNSLDIALLYLLAAVLGVLVFRSLKLPPMLGYLAVGVVIGPNALALAQDSSGIRYLAEFGVVFLMFVIGLEFSLPKLRAMRRHVFGLGLSQVVATVLVTTGASLLLGLLLPRWWSISSVRRWPSVRPTRRRPFRSASMATPSCWKTACVTTRSAKAGA